MRKSHPFDVAKQAAENSKKRSCAGKSKGAGRHKLYANEKITGALYCQILRLYFL